MSTKTMTCFGQDDVIRLDAALPNLDILVELVLHSDIECVFDTLHEFPFFFFRYSFFTGRNKLERAKARFLCLTSLK